MPKNNKLNIVDCELADGTTVQLANSMRLLGIIERKASDEIQPGIDLLLGKIDQNKITTVVIQTALYVFYLEGYLTDHSSLKGCIDYEKFMYDLFPDDDQYVRDVMNQVVNPKETGDSKTSGSKKQTV